MSDHRHAIETAARALRPHLLAFEDHFLTDLATAAIEAALPELQQAWADEADELIAKLKQSYELKVARYDDASGAGAWTYLTVPVITQQGIADGDSHINWPAEDVRPATEGGGNGGDT